MSSMYWDAEFTSRLDTIEHIASKNVLNDYYLSWIAALEVKSPMAAQKKSTLIITLQQHGFLTAVYLTPGLLRYF